MTQDSNILKSIEGKVAIVVLALVCLKPVIDFSAPFRLASSLNFQGVVALFVLMLALGITFFRLSKNRFARGSSEPIVYAVDICFALFSVLAAINILWAGFSKTLILKYWASLSGVVIIPWAIEVVYRKKPRLNWPIALIFFSIMLVISGLMFQRFVTTLHRRLDFFAGVGNIVRLTGFYDHPFETFRALIWPMAILGVNFISGSRKKMIICGVALFTLQAILLKTTHRTSLMLSILLPIIVGFIYGRAKRGMMLTGIIALAWLSWNIVPNSVITPDRIFSTQNFKDVEKMEVLIEKGQVTPGDEQSILKPFLKEQSFGRGRSRLWARHIQWISDYTWYEMLLGGKKPMTVDPRILYPEPHNQLIDAFETFGLLGVILIFGIFLFGIIRVPADPMLKFSILFCVAWYSVPAEPLAAPTFLWWGMLFFTLARKKTSIFENDQKVSENLFSGSVFQKFQIRFKVPKTQT